MQACRTTDPRARPPTVGHVDHERKGNLFLGWIRPALVHGEFMESMLGTVAAGWEHLDGWKAVRTVSLAAGRNSLVHHFLYETQAKWLLLVDTDMVWQPDAVELLLAAADPQKAPIVGGLCFGQDRASGRLLPTLYDHSPNSGRFHRISPWLAEGFVRTGGVVQVGGTGAAFLLVHRDVFVAIGEKHSVAYPWFQETETSTGDQISEDLTFCQRAAAAGFPLYVHTGARIGHIKDRAVGATDYLHQQTGRQHG